jgi:hypothetical protein
MRLNDDKSERWFNTNYMEKQKNLNFKNAFKDLWPNLYDQINFVPPKVEPKPQSVPTYMQPMPIIVTNPLCHVNHSSCHGYHSCDCTHKGCKKIDDKPSYPNWDTIVQVLNKKPTKLDEEKPSKYSLSSYDLPDSSMPDKVDFGLSALDLKILESIKQKNAKLREQNKIEKTSDLVDGILRDVGVLQADLKKKAAEVKLKEDLVKMESEIFTDFVKMSRDCCGHRQHHNSRSKSPADSVPCQLRRKSRSKSRENSVVHSHHRHESRSKSREKPLCQDFSHHNHHHHYQESTSKSRDRVHSSCNHYHPAALTKHHYHHDETWSANKHQHHHHPQKTVHVHHGQKSPLMRSSSTLVRPSTSSWKHAKPKVVSWRCDMNVY